MEVKRGRTDKAEREPIFRLIRRYANVILLLPSSVLKTAITNPARIPLTQKWCSDVSSRLVGTLMILRRLKPPRPPRPIQPLKFKPYV